MKNILKSLSSIGVLVFVCTAAHGQIQPGIEGCTSYPNLSVIATNVVCQNDAISSSHLEFDLTISSDGIFENLTFGNDFYSNEISDWVTSNLNGSLTAINGERVIFADGSGCLDISQIQFAEIYNPMEPSGPCYPFIQYTPPIPTMGQWAMLILGMCILTCGVVVIRNNKLVYS